LTRQAARNCIIMNQLATPGLGSLLGGRIVAGLLQLLLAIAGFLLVFAWFVMTMIQYYGMITGDVQVKSHTTLALSGAALFIFSWLWALVTSISLWQQSKIDSPIMPNVPPPIINPRQ
jgi:hypothetical protein